MTWAWCWGVQQAVLRQLQARYGSLYSAENVILSATHTHGGPGGFSHYALYNFTTYGFNSRTFDAIVSGIVAAIDKAHRDLKPGSIAIGKGELTDASNNRSNPAYLRNPQSERDRWGRNIDPEMTVLRFRQGGNDVGAISWFATHGVSMTPMNRLITPDNKGYAEWRWEHDLKGVRYNSDSDFVAAFAQSNAGDMTPNLNLTAPGPRAMNSITRASSASGSCRRRCPSTTARWRRWPGRWITGSAISTFRA